MTNPRAASGLRRCIVCTDPLPESRQRRLYCAGCKQAMNYLAAIGRVILARKWTPRQAFLLRRQIIKIANWLPTRWERQRAPNGRFKGTL